MGKESFGHYQLRTIDAAGLTTIDKIAKGGIAGNREQGLPASTVTVNWVRLG